MTSIGITGASASKIEDFVTEASADALNAALAERGIDAAHIVSVLLIHGTRLGSGAGDQYRVLYRS